MAKAQTHHRETFSSLLATHEAIRIARDVGYPPIEIASPPPATPNPIPLAYLNTQEEQISRYWLIVLASVVWVLNVAFWVYLLLI